MLIYMASFLKKFLKNPTNEPKLTEQTQLHFLKRLHRLLENGYPIINALELMKWDKQMDQTISILNLALKEGNTLDESFEDRKSTRLNSSHVAISYAVFC